MAKQSVIEMRKALAAQEQANAVSELADRVAKLEAKIDQLIEALTPKSAKSEKGKGA